MKRSDCHGCESCLNSEMPLYDKNSDSGEIVEAPRNIEVDKSEEGDITLKMKTMKTIEELEMQRFFGGNNFTFAHFQFFRLYIFPQ